MIREPEAFVERVRIAVRSQLPDWQLATRDVGYYDPVGVKPAEIEVAWFNIFRYISARGPACVVPTAPGN